MSWLAAGLFVLAASLVLSAAWLARAQGAGPGASTLALGQRQLQAELARLAAVQEDLRRDVQGAREASLLQLSQATLGIRGELSAAQRALAEVRALEEGRAGQMQRAAESLRRLEAVVAGSSSRGAAGENILARALGQLPPDLLEVNVSFGSRVVEYALRLPGGRLLPLDSKWTSVASLEPLPDAPDGERRRLVEQVGRDLRLRIREMTRYLEPERTVGLAVLAVPDAVYEAGAEMHGEGYREGVLVVPYSLALPFLLALYRLTARFGGSLEARHTAEGLRLVDEALRRAAEEVEARLSRGLVQLGNARDALREHLAGAQRTTARLLDEAAERPGLPADVPVASTREP